MSITSSNGKNAIWVISFLVCGVMAMANDIITTPDIFKALKDRDTFVLELMDSFQQAKNKEIKASILFALGEMRSEKAIPLLISNIDFESEDIVSRLPKYPIPAVTALGKIGIPAIRPILNEIKINTDANKATYLYYAIISIDGAELAIFLLEKEIKNTISDEEVKRLNYVLSMVKEQCLREQNAKMHDRVKNSMNTVKK